jgi:hypothetical protein
MGFLLPGPIRRGGPGPGRPAFDLPLDEFPNECVPMTILVRIGRCARHGESSEKKIGEAPAMARRNGLLVQHEPRRRSHRQ